MGKGLICALLIIFYSSHILIGQGQPFPSSDNSPKIHADLLVIKINPQISTSGRVASNPVVLETLKEIVAFEEFHQVFSNTSFTNSRVAESDLQNIYKLRFIGRIRPSGIL